MTMASKRRVSLEWRDFRWLCMYRHAEVGYGECHYSWDGCADGRCRIDTCPLILGDEQHKPIIIAARDGKKEEQ